MSNKQNDHLPKTIGQAIEGMELSFNPEQAKELAATIQFYVSGEGGGEWVLEIENGRCQCRTGTIADPTLTIKTPADVWLAVARKEKSGAMALMTGKYKASGKMGLMLKMDKIFSRQLTEEEVRLFQKA